MSNSDIATFCISRNDAHTLRLLLEDQAEGERVNGTEEDAIFYSRMAKALIPEPADPKVAAYLAENGTVCPHCRSREITGGSVDINGNQAFQSVTCGDCHAEWTDVYRLDNVEFDSQ